MYCSKALIGITSQALNKFAKIAMAIYNRLSRPILRFRRPILPRA